MDINRHVLNEAQADLLNEILARRRPELFERLRRHGSSVSRSDADTIMSILSDEIADNLDADWEPTAYGQTVNAVLTRFNTARLDEWP